MTGKDFFGKLLNNRRDEPLPLDRDDSGTGVPDADIEVAPSSYDVHEEEARSFDDVGEVGAQAHASDAPSEGEHPNASHPDAPRVSFDVEEDIAGIPIGGDGQSSPLPDVSPSVHHGEHAEERVNMQRELRSVLLDSSEEPASNGEPSSSSDEHRGRDSNLSADQSQETVLPEPIRLRATGGRGDDTPADSKPEHHPAVSLRLPEEPIQLDTPEDAFVAPEPPLQVQETSPAEAETIAAPAVEPPVFVPSSELNGTPIDAFPAPEQAQEQDHPTNEEPFSDTPLSDVQEPAIMDAPAPHDEVPSITVSPPENELGEPIVDMPSSQDQMSAITDVTPAREENSPVFESEPVEWREFSITETPEARGPEPTITETPEARRPEPTITETPDARHPEPSITETPAPQRPEPTITETPAARRQEPTITETPQAAPQEPAPADDPVPLDEVGTDADYNRESTEAPLKAEEDNTPPPPPKKAAAGKGDTELRGLKDRVVLRLLEKNIVTPEHVKAALLDRSQENLKATLWRIVAQQRGADREKVYREAALTYAFVERKLDEDEVDLDFIRQVADVFPEKRRNRLIELRVVPVGYEFEQQTQLLRVVFLTHDPSLPAVRELMQELNLERYELQYASETTVKELLAKAFPRKNEYLERMSEDPLAYDLGMSYEDDKGELIDEEALEAEINRSSLINLFEAALVESVHKGASDIHIYPNAKRQIEIHFRVDGRLLLWHVEDKVHPESLLAVIKDNTTNVDRFEREMAQDGFIQRKVDDTIIRYRVSILPIATAHQSMHSESIVIRVLDDRKVITDLSQLGLLKGAIERFDMAIRQPHGMVILTGPTGSGKSTTLVAALHQVVDPGVNVLSVEDPVEYIIPGVRQIKLNHKLDLEQALRSILRHDPDVVMVGEMRDRHTAELAIKLANTGHLTFSTLHTNDAPSAVSRLYKMGVEPFLIAYAINLVVAQRLIRKLCPDCKVIDNDPDFVLLDRMGFTQQDLAEIKFYKPSGDPTCKTCKGVGFKGRRAISEALYFSRAIRHLIVEAHMKIDEDGLRVAAQKEGMLTLQDSAREVVKMGETSTDEMMRVTMVDE